jgi:hypothetical protein
MFTKVKFELLCVITFSYFFLACCPCWKLSMHWSSLHIRYMYLLQLCCRHKDLLGSILFSLNVDPAKKYVFNIFKNFQGLITYNHSNVHLKWKTSSLDLNTPSNEYSALDSSSYTFWDKCVNATSEKVHVT